MEKLTNIDQLQPGTHFIVVDDGEFCNCEVINYEFSCIHPRNSRYIIAIESLSQEPRVLLIDNLLGKTIHHPKVYVGEFDQLFINKLYLEYHKKCVDYWTSVVQEEELRRSHNG